MASQVQIVNLALSQLGKAQIVTIDDASDPARRAKAAWAPILQEVLRAHAWGFATKHNALVKAVEEEAAGWSCVYTYPADCLKVQKLYSTALPDAAQPYEKRQNAAGTGIVLACNIEDAVLAYTVDLSAAAGAALYDAGFINAVVHRLAAHLAKALTGDDKLAQTMLGLYQMALDSAKADDAREQHKDPDSETGNPYWAAR